MSTLTQHNSTVEPRAESRAAGVTGESSVDVAGPMSHRHRMVRLGYDLAIHGAKHLAQDRAPQMAAALAFRTLFAMLPVVIVSTVVVKGLKGVEDFQKLVGWLVDAAGLRSIQIPTEVAGGEPVGLGQWMQDLVGRMADISLQTLGWVGLAVVAYSAIAVMVTIENSFNMIYRAPSGRSWARRVPLYWFVLTISPVAMGLAVYVDQRVSGAIGSVHSWGWALAAVGSIWSFCIAWLFLFAVYKLVPNANVAAKPALMGSFVAAALLTIGKQALAIYISRAFSFSYLYASVGLIPVFMFWVYVMWLVVLFGLEVSAILQMVGGRKLEPMEPPRPLNEFVDPAAVLEVMRVVAGRFAQSQSASVEDIAQESSLPSPIVARIVARLTERGLLHRLDSEREAVSLARPPEAIPAELLLDIGHELADGATGRDRPALMEQLRQAQRQAASGSTVASMLAPQAAGVCINQVS